MSINLNDNIQVSSGKPLDSRYLNGLSAYVSVAAVNSAIPISTRYLGLTVLIGTIEYWYQNAITDVGLIIKSSGISASNNISITRSVLIAARNAGTLVPNATYEISDRFNYMSNSLTPNYVVIGQFNILTVPSNIIAGEKILSTTSWTTKKLQIGTYVSGTKTLESSYTWVIPNPGDIILVKRILVPVVEYYINYVSTTTNPTTIATGVDRGLITLKALTTNLLETKGTRLMYVPSQYTVGTDVNGNIWTGLYNKTATYSLNQLFIYANRVFKSVSGSPTTGVPIDTTFFQVAGYEWIQPQNATNSEYTQFISDIQYDIDKDWIGFQTDNNNNTIGTPQNIYNSNILVGNANPCDISDWGLFYYYVYYNNKVPNGIFGNNTTYMHDVTCVTVYDNNIDTIININISGNISGNTMNYIDKCYGFQDITNNNSINTQLIGINVNKDLGYIFSISGVIDPDYIAVDNVLYNRATNVIYSYVMVSGVLDITTFAPFTTVINIKSASPTESIISGSINFLNKPLTLIGDNTSSTVFTFVHDGIGIICDGGANITLDSSISEKVLITPLYYDQNNVVNVFNIKKL